MAASRPSQSPVLNIVMTIPHRFTDTGTTLVKMICLILLTLCAFSRGAEGFPLSSSHWLMSRSPVTQSNEVWATLIANVAPLMTLVSERNAKDFLRVSSSRDQLWLMAVTPLGLFSLIVCAIRLRLCTH